MCIQRLVHKTVHNLQDKEKKQDPIKKPKKLCRED
jgi:hypothetical protein